MGDEIIFIAHVNVRSVAMHPVISELAGLQYGDIIEIPLEQREKSDWDEWVDKIYRSQYPAIANRNSKLGIGVEASEGV
jgi:hypothetical protein